MRNRLISSDSAAQDAGNGALVLGGNAVDAVLAAMLAGAVRGSPSSLLGSAVITVAGLGVGAYAVDGRARAPGLGMPRMPSPASPPTRDSVAVPGLVEGALAAHNRFGSLVLSRVVKAAMDAVKEHEENKDVQLRARLTCLEAVHRHGPQWMAKTGVAQALLEAAGLPAKGVLGRDDLEPVAAPVIELKALAVEHHELLTMEPDRVAPFAPPTPPATPIGVAIAGDMHGVFATAAWAIAGEACILEGEFGLSGASLNNAPTKGVTRRAPGTRIAMPTPLCLVRTAASVWAAAAVSGEGALDAGCDALVQGKLLRLAQGAAPRGVRGMSYWLVRETGDELRASEEALSR
ncbi:MAG: gamma-glutamyltransferase [Deltaproteobacteria bacterium]|nr:gamma-glutamyltransferase [Deltaproteobacteria bacterium]